MLPDGGYERVVIHDNFKALQRFADNQGKGCVALQGLTKFNGRFIVFYLNEVTLIATGMGSAQTNCLVESLKRKNCKIIVKVGTCSALDSSLKEGNGVFGTLLKYQGAANSCCRSDRGIAKPCPSA